MRGPSLLLLASFLAFPPSSAQAEEALLVVADRSASMANDDKWTISTSGIMQALDQDAFDAFDLGLVAAPTGTLAGPACILGLPVACAYPLLPQQALGPAGPKSADGPGGRRSIRDWLLANPPSGASDELPLYGAIQTGIAALQAWSGTGHRILVVITDGGISCGSFSNPARPGYTDCNSCDHEWDHPLNFVGLIEQAHDDPSKPIDTFLLGVPGADSIGATCSSPPYSMRLALSAMAAAGSMHVSGGCTGTTYVEMGVDPSVPCHYDLTSGTFDADTVANVLTQILELDLSDIFVDGFESGDVSAWGGSTGSS